MKVYRITNFIIVALVIAAIYQTGELWLEGTSGHNFFYALAKQLSFGKEEADGDVLLATRYAVGEGEGTFRSIIPIMWGIVRFWKRRIRLWGDSVPKRRIPSENNR